MQIRTRGRFAVALAAIALLGLAGCEDEKKKESVADAGVQDAGPSQPVVGGKLGAALAAAASASAAPPARHAGADGPPETGVFAPGASAATLPKGTPYKLELLGEGSEPRAKLAAALDPKAEQKVAILLGIRMGGSQGLPGIEFEMSFKVDKPKKDGPAKDGPAKEGGAAPAAAGTPVVGKVVSATLASMGLGGPPKELTDALGKLKGSLIRYQLAPTGAVSDVQIELAKDADPGLVTVLQGLGEAISLLTTPLPDKPVGAGAYWMVADRAVWAGGQIPVLRYRVFKIDKIEGGAVTFAVDMRQYAEDSTAKLPAAAQEVSVTIDQFESSGKGTVTWSPASLAPQNAELGHRLQARLIPPGSPPGGQQRMALQTELNAKFSPPAAAPP